MRTLVRVVQSVRPTRRWLRLSLRAMLVLMTLAGAALGWLARHVETARREEAALEGLTQASAYYDYQYRYDAGGDHWLLPGTPPGPEWLRRRLGDKLFTNVVHLTCRANFTSDDLPRVLQFHELISLNLWDAAFADDDVRLLGRLRALRTVDFKRSTLTDAGLGHVGRLVQLERLCLHETEISEAGLASLAPLGRLKWLQIAESRSAVLKRHADRRRARSDLDCRWPSRPGCGSSARRSRAPVACTWLGWKCSKSCSWAAPTSMTPAWPN